MTAPPAARVLVLTALVVLAAGVAGVVDGAVGRRTRSGGRRPTPGAGRPRRPGRARAARACCAPGTYAGPRRGRGRRGGAAALYMPGSRAGRRDVAMLAAYGRAGCGCAGCGCRCSPRVRARAAAARRWW